MKIEDFLASTMIEGINLLYTMQTGEDSFFDSISLKEDGTFLTDKEFLEKFGNQLYSTELYDFVYTFILDTINLDDKDFDEEELISFLAKNYLLSTTAKENFITSFLRKHTTQEVLEHFLEEEDFALKLLAPSFSYLSTPTKQDIDRKKILKSGKIKELEKWELHTEEKMLVIFGKAVRQNICDLYNYYISMGFGDIEALNYTWLFLTNGLGPDSLENVISYPQLHPFCYRNFFLRLLYSDLCEDTLNQSLLCSENSNDRLASFLPVFITYFFPNTFPLVLSEEIRNRMLKIFILLQDDPEKQKENRLHTYKEKQSFALKKINPSFSFDEYFM